MSPTTPTHAVRLHDRDVSDPTTVIDSPADAQTVIDPSTEVRQEEHNIGKEQLSSTSAVERSRPDLVLKEVPQPAQDIPHKPRNKAPRRAIEYTLKNADPHVRSNPFRRHARQLAFAAPYPDSGVVLSRADEGESGTRRGWRAWKLPGPLSFDTWQGWYLVLFHCIGATIISGAVNFGIACAMYRSQSDITYWVLARNTVAGDMGVTVLIQSIVTFVITSSMVHSDLTTGSVAPLSRPWPPLLHLPSTPSRRGFAFFGTRLPLSVPEGESLPMGPLGTNCGAFKPYALWIIRSAYTGSERNDLLAPGISWRQRLERLVWTAAQGLLIGVIVFPWFWGIAMAITAPIYSARNLGHTWAPQVIKLIYGGLLGLVTNPFIALMAMGAESSVKRAYPELNIWQQEGQGPHAEYIHA
ncbi:hypothetical protein K437DRAFT_26939 [Tilletiaria anomala UBC 951]|uniref:Uncharacterized protein n=1 Tax=Tilletiaria anomala (strain ATCC 24038 / CBS 436.72 / UBC 951) TaxID=1037660 RepID=A0A066WEA7_TILAU|nr:uncharacterized protein K437DRAFT_26939 [Tilletiaria anomala UBC 951]KDN52287.1 hypothetical protein K437DRAFT_26939 [Tilletiaria anomala UBC 951]